MYSKEAIELVELYYRTWPKIFQFLSGSSMNELAFETDLFQESGQLDQICKWLKQQPHANAERRACGTAALELDTLKEIVLAVNESFVSAMTQINIIVVIDHFYFIFLEATTEEDKASGETSFIV